MINVYKEHVKETAHGYEGGSFIVKCFLQEEMITDRVKLYLIKWEDLRLHIIRLLLFQTLEED